MNFYTPAPRRGRGVYCFTSVRLSVRPRYFFRRIFLSNYWWQKSDIWSQASYRYTILWVAFLDASDSYFLFADLVGLYTHWTYMHIFCHIFLSNYWWQRSDIWSQASYRYPILWEAFLDPSDSYFLFADSVDFSTHWTYMLIFRRIFLGNYWWQKSDIWSQASYRYPISWEAFFDPSDSYFLFAKERGYHRWALAHSSSCFSWLCHVLLHVFTIMIILFKHHRFTFWKESFLYTLKGIVSRIDVIFDWSEKRRFFDFCKSPIFRIFTQKLNRQNTNV
jgi:hypothetical protein